MPNGCHDTVAIDVHTFLWVCGIHTSPLLDHAWFMQVFESGQLMTATSFAHAGQPGSRHDPYYMDSRT